MNRDEFKSSLEATLKNVKSMLSAREAQVDHYERVRERFGENDPELARLVYLVDTVQIAPLRDLVAYIERKTERTRG